MANSIHLSHQISSFLHSSNSQPKIQIQHSLFDHYIGDSIILTTQAFMIHKVYEFFQQILIEEPVVIYDSVFRHFHRKQDVKGTITVTHRIRLYNVLFYEIDGESGSCIHSTSGGLDIAFTTFSKCAGDMGAGFESRNSEDNKDTVDSCTFHITIANLFSGFYYASNSLLNVLNNNATDLTARGAVAIFEVNTNAVTVRGNFFSNTTSFHNGGIVVRYAFITEIKDTVFYKCVHQSPEIETAAAILVVETNGKVRIEGSRFVDNWIEASYDVTILVRYPLELVGCLFTNREEKAIYCIMGDCVGNDSTFGVKVALKETGMDVGYRKDRTQTYFVRSGSIGVQMVVISAVLAVCGTAFLRGFRKTRVQSLA